MNSFLHPELHLSGFWDSRKSRRSKPETPNPELQSLNPTWRFMGGYQWGYLPPNMSYMYSCPTYTYKLPMNLQVSVEGLASMVPEAPKLQHARTFSQR